MAEQESKKVSALLGIGIFFMPYIFAWKLLDRGYGAAARRVGFSWMAICVVLWLAGHNGHQQNPSTQPLVAAAIAPAAPSGAQPTPPASPADPAKDRSDAKGYIAVAQEHVKLGRADLVHHYGTQEQIHIYNADLAKMTAIIVHANLTNDRDDIKQSSQAKALGIQLTELIRDTYASSMEESFVKNGMDIKVRSQGKNKDQLRLSYALMSRPLVYQFQNEAHLPAQAALVGFKKLILTNGFDGEMGQTWTINLDDKT
jgi:hypothetical protein